MEPTQDTKTIRYPLSVKPIKSYFYICTLTSGKWVTVNNTAYTTEEKANIFLDRIIIKEPNKYFRYIPQIIKS